MTDKRKRDTLIDKIDFRISKEDRDFVEYLKNTRIFLNDAELFRELISLIRTFESIGINIFSYEFQKFIFSCEEKGLL
jgi:hypothetical protein